MMKTFKTIEVDREVLCGTMQILLNNQELSYSARLLGFYLIEKALRRNPDDFIVAVTQKEIQNELGLSLSQYQKDKHMLAKENFFELFPINKRKQGFKLKLAGNLVFTLHNSCDDENSN